MATAIVRQPAVAGLFYPREPQVLAAAVDQHLAAGRVRLAEAGFDLSAPPRALVAPHAGYVYSGPIAGTAFATLTPFAQQIRRVVLLGPAHRVPVRGLALPGADALATPLGDVAVSREMVAALAGLPQVVVAPRVHAPEHALEVELPFLQRLLAPGWEVLPLVVGDADEAEVAAVLARVWALPATLTVISSDLSHYLPYDTARRVDRATADAVLGLGGPLVAEEACGAAPWNGLLALARRDRLHPHLLDLRSSGDTAGDRDAVVGYGAFAFTDTHAH
jgi:AmmeMemoRadiSam system protein B